MGEAGNDVCGSYVIRELWQVEVASMRRLDGVAIWEGDGNGGCVTLDVACRGSRCEEMTSGPGVHDCREGFGRKVFAVGGVVVLVRGEECIIIG